MTATGWREIRGGGTEQKGKRTHGHGQLCGDCWGEDGYMRVKLQWKQYNKKNFFNKK